MTVEREWIRRYLVVCLLCLVDELNLILSFSLTEMQF